MHKPIMDGLMNLAIYYHRITHLELQFQLQQKNRELLGQMVLYMWRRYKFNQLKHEFNMMLAVGETLIVGSQESVE
jgi:hypothetical protein